MGEGGAGGSGDWIGVILLLLNYIEDKQQIVGRQQEEKTMKTAPMLQWRLGLVILCDSPERIDSSSESERSSGCAVAQFRCL